MSSDVPIAVPSGYSPPFQVVDDSHHGAWVIIATALGLVIALVSFLIRVYVRVALNPPFAVDDGVLLGATIVTVVQSTLLFVAVSEGFGTAIDLLSDSEVDTVQILITTSDILYLIAIYICKACVVGIHLRLTPQKRQNQLAWATLALCTAWVVTAVFVIAVNCEFNTPWKGTGAQCVDLLARWQFIVAIDILTELLLFGLAIVLLSGLFMPLKRKVAIGSAFMFRLPLILPITLHLITLTQNLNSPDATLSSVSPVIWAQVELDYSLVACSVFCLRPFMAAVSTNYGTAGDSNLESSVGEGNSGSNGSRGQGHGQDQSRRWSWSWSRGQGHSGHGQGKGHEQGQGHFWSCRSGCGNGERSGQDQSGEGHSDDDPGKRGKGREGTGLTEDSMSRTLSDEGMIIRWFSRAGKSAVRDEGIELEAERQGKEGKMVIRKDVQYSVEFKKNSRSEDDGALQDMEYWDRYLDPRP